MDAEGVAEGTVHVIASADVLAIAEAHAREAIPVALHRTGDWCTVLFVTRLPLGAWRTDVVPVFRGQVNAIGGATGGMVRRSDVEPGKPFKEGESRTGADRGLCLVAAAGVSADEAIRMRSGDEVVAEAAVAPHGYFVISAVLPCEAEIRVEAGDGSLGEARDS